MKKEIYVIDYWGGSSGCGSWQCQKTLEDKKDFIRLIKELKQKNKFINASIQIFYDQKDLEELLEEESVKEDRERLISHNNS